MTRKVALLVPVLLLLCLVCASCGGQDPVQACKDLVEAGAESLSKCGFDLDTARSTIQTQLGGCIDVVSIRDEKQLYADCIPEFRGLTCAQWQMGDLPPACAAQLER